MLRNDAIISFFTDPLCCFMRTVVVVCMCECVCLGGGDARARKADSDITDVTMILFCLLLKDERCRL